MAFAGSETDGRRDAGGLCLQGVRICLQLVAGAAALGLLACALLYMRLSQGPLDLPPVAKITAEIVNSNMQDARISIGGASLTLGSRGAPSGLRFRDVRVTSLDGTLLLAAPSLAARFHLADLVKGNLRPTRMVLVGARARVLRDTDGRIRVGLGTGPGVVVGGPAGGAAGAGEGSGGPLAADESRAGSDAVASIIEGIVGDEAPVPLLTRLQHVAALGTALTYEDAISGRLWHTRGSDLRIYKTSYGARAVMQAAVTERAEEPTRLLVTAERRAKTGRTDFAIRFEGLRPAVLAEQARALSWAGLLDAALVGHVSLAVQPDGTLGPLEGEMSAENGRLLAVPKSAQAFRSVRLGFRAEAGLQELALTHFDVDGDALKASVQGDLVVEGDDPLSAGALAAQLYVRDLVLNLPERFSEPVRFAAGQAIARVQLDPLEVELGHLHLSEGALTLSASGQAWQVAEDWRFGLRASAQGATVADLKRLWPFGAGGNARPWVVANIYEGEIPQILAQLHVAEGEPELALDFQFEGVGTRYLGAMPPITGGRGTGHLTLEAFDLALEDGQVAPEGGAPIALGGSRLRIPDLGKSVPDADIRLDGDGPILSVLDLIDHAPLRLVSKLGIDLGDVRGRAEVGARIRFPLLAALRIGEIDVDVEAGLTRVATALKLGGAPPLSVSAREIALTATEEEMSLAGRVEADGTPLTVRWEERYGARPGRRLALRGDLTPELLAARGLDVPGFQSGVARSDLTLVQSAGESRITADLDLAGADLAIKPLRWAKAAGRPGTLAVRGRLGDRVSLDSIALDASGLSIEGSVSLGADGRLEQARFSQIRVGERLDLAAEIARDAGAGFEVSLKGKTLDLSDHIRNPPSDDSSGQLALRVSAEVDRLILTPKLKVSPAKGDLTTAADGAITLELSGKAAGRAAFHTRYARRAGAPGTVRMTSENTGRLLSALGLFHGGLGGDLILDAVFRSDGPSDLSGEAEIRNMRVSGADTFGAILEEGGADTAAQEVEGSGVLFDSITIPFDYADGVLALGESIARSPSLAVKVEGEVNEAANELSLYGVISPAYGLTGALDEVPVLGTLLSGGEGEGIFAMTFQAYGSLDDPSFEVNPLSILTPGILRGVFSGRAAKPRQDFLDQLGPTE